MVYLRVYVYMSVCVCVCVSLSLALRHLFEIVLEIRVMRFESVHVRDKGISRRDGLRSQLYYFPLGFLHHTHRRYTEDRQSDR